MCTLRCLLWLFFLYCSCGTSQFSYDTWNFHSNRRTSNFLVQCEPFYGSNKVSERNVSKVTPPYHLMHPRVTEIRLWRIWNIGPFRLFSFTSYIGNSRNPLVINKIRWSLHICYCGVQLYLLQESFKGILALKRVKKVHITSREAPQTSNITLTSLTTVEAW